MKRLIDGADLAGKLRTRKANAVVHPEAMDAYETAMNDAIDAEEITLNALRDEVYQDAVKHGLWEEADKMAKEETEGGKEGYPGEKELIEKFFKWHEAAQLVFFEGDEMLTAVEDYNWDSAVEELADVVIMAMSAAGYLGIDIDAAVKRKMQINKGRPWKHEGEK